MNRHGGSGWGWPAASKKAHYFSVGTVSLCGGWMYSGQLLDSNNNSPDNCVKCKKIVEKRKQTGHL